MVITNSTFSAMIFGDAAIFAPFCSTSAVFPPVLLYTVTSNPESSKCSATAFPNIPIPMIPTFIEFLLRNF